MSQSTQANGSHPTEEKTARQCVKYSFFKIDPAFRRLPDEKQIALKMELIHTIRDFNRRMLLRSYSLFGIRGAVDFMLWQVADGVATLDSLVKAILPPHIGPNL